MALSALVALVLRDSADTLGRDSILALFFAGGFLAWPPGLVAARLLSFGRRRDTQLAACLLCLGAATVGMTAFLFAMEYRLFYARWHQPFGTRIWVYQFIYTSAAAVYQFLVTGLRFYLPVGATVLAATSLWLAGLMPRTRR